MEFVIRQDTVDSSFNAHILFVTAVFHLKLIKNIWNTQKTQKLTMLTGLAFLLIQL